MAHRNIWPEEEILQLLADGTNSELSDCDTEPENDDIFFPYTELEDLLWINDLNDLDFEEEQLMMEEAREQQATDITIRQNIVQLNESSGIEQVTERQLRSINIVDPQPVQPISIIKKSDIKWSTLPFQKSKICLKKFLKKLFHLIYQHL